MSGFWIYHESKYASVTCETLAYLDSWYIQNPDIFRTRSIFRIVAYSQHWYIQNPGIFRTLAYSKSEAYSEPCQTSTMKPFAKIVNGYNYFHELKLFSQYELAAISTLRNKYHEYRSNFYSRGTYSM